MIPPGLFRIIAPRIAPVTAIPTSSSVILVSFEGLRCELPCESQQTSRRLPKGPLEVFGAVHTPLQSEAEHQGSAAGWGSAEVIHNTMRKVRQFINLSDAS